MTKFTDEHRRKIAEAHRGQSSGMKGKTHSEETRSKMAKAHTGKKHSDETKAKMADKRKAYWQKKQILSNQQAQPMTQTVAGLKIVRYE